MRHDFTSFQTKLMINVERTKFVNNVSRKRWQPCASHTRPVCCTLINILKIVIFLTLATECLNDELAQATNICIYGIQLANSLCLVIKLSLVQIGTSFDLAPPPLSSIISFCSIVIVGRLALIRRWQPAEYHARTSMGIVIRSVLGGKIINAFCVQHP